MTIVVTRDVAHFAERARPFLETSLECNLLATILASVLDGLHPAGQALYAYRVDDDEVVGCAALRTPPWSMLASTWPADDTPALIEQWLEQDRDLPGVNAPSGTARAIAGAWSARTGGATTCRLAEAMHVLFEVRGPARPASGSLRAATAAERPLLVDWMRAFVEEAGLTGADQAAAMVDVRMARGSLLVWEDGAPVSMLGVARAARVVRVGPVYTPPESRRRGYAGSAVAAASRRALAAGAEACMLFTDLANPTSNKIYAEVGYERRSRWEEHAFAVA